MTENRPIQKVLQDLIVTQNFEKLDEFSDLSFLSTLTDEERELLAKLYVLQAEDLLKRSSEPHLIEVAKKSLSKAAELAPLNYKVWYQRGLAYAKGENEEALQEALYSLEVACQLDATFFDGWYAMANVLCRLGVLKDDDSMLYDAEAKFVKAESYFDKERGGEFYWHRGLVMYVIARRSGEPNEFNQAINYYKRAFELGLSKESYFNDYANALVECASLLNRDEWIFEAIELYLSSLPPSIEDFEQLAQDKAKEYAVRYFNLAGCYYYLFRSRLEMSYFLLGNEYFEKAARCNPLFFQAHFHWGRLLLFASKIWQDANHLRAAVIRFEQALKLSSAQPLLYASFCEALGTLGNHEENAEHLQNAKLVIEKGLKFDPENSDLQASEALLYYQFGRYFNDEKYYEKSLSILTECLSQNQRQSGLWYSQAMCQFALGELTGNLNILKVALNSFDNASKFEMGRFGYFWNDWGLTLITIAEQTREKQYLLEAEEKFERAILLHDNVEPEWLFNYGCTLDFLGDFTDEETYYERAIQALSAALTIEPNYASARCHLACAYANLGEMMEEVELFQKAFTEFQHVVGDDPEDDLAYNEWGVAILHFIELTSDPLVDSTELFNQAEKNFLQAISLGNLHAFYNLACLYSLQGNIPDAIFYFEKSVKHEILPFVEDLVQDEWLLNLRNTQYFHKYLQENSES
jgi:tetratricopeptide (TPR) repeat protein